MLSPVNRAVNGHRRYSNQDIAWIEFLTKLRTTGMPIRQMLQFAQLRKQGDETVTQRRKLLESHFWQVQQQLDELSQNLAAIQEKIAFLQKIGVTT